MSSTEQNVNVYIWDMDETLVLLKSLLDGSFAQAYNGSKDLKRGMEIGRQWENSILQLCDDLFHYNHIEEYNMPFLEYLKEHDDGRDLLDYDFSKDNFGFPHDNSLQRKLAYRFRDISQKYSKGLKSVLDGEKIKLWDDLYDATDIYTDRWLSSARDFVKQLSCKAKDFGSQDIPSDSATNFNNINCQTINVLVTNGSLIPSLAKCLLFRLDDLISHENVYSSWEVGKLQCFSWIKEKYGSPSVRFCAIGDGNEECLAAEKMKWPFVSIDLDPEGTHRFPGLQTKTLGFYMDVVYGEQPKHENDKDNKL